MTSIKKALEIKDPIHGYVSISDIEKDILDLRMAQRLRNIKAPTCIHLVFPGADPSLFGHVVGVIHVTDVFMDYLGGDVNEIQAGRLTALLLILGRGAWENVMEEYLAIRGISRTKVLKLAIEGTELGDVIEKSPLTKIEVIDFLEKGVPLKSVRVNLLENPINPTLVDRLERDAYFAGVEYAQLEYRRLFASTRIAKNKIAINRGALFTLESYLSAGANMFDAVYYHKTVRAADLMLLRILELAGTELVPFPTDDIEAYIRFDDISFHDVLLHAGPEDSEEMQEAGKIFREYRKRNLIKLAAQRSVTNADFLKKIATPDGLYKIETEIAEEADLDPSNVYLDYPDRLSVMFYPGMHPLDDLVLFERGSRGYEFFSLPETSQVARSFYRVLKSIRVYTTRGYRTKLRKVAEQFLESIDEPTSK
ncbi:MAG: hypothetical protein BAJATHORv1_30351 [Candidatus Thorarchaeota archaeon]|nr:MAG: hypothetical protein BAJATHORv1_30351 [Candidatus Thorarchaeota archaeon]